MVKDDQNYMRRDRDCSLDRRLNVSSRRISGLADPTDADDAVTMRYVASRLDVLQNLLGVENNQDY